MAAAADTTHEDEFDAFYGDEGFDEASLAQAELQATQVVRAQSAQPAPQSGPQVVAPLLSTQRKRTAKQQQQHYHHHEQHTAPSNKRQKLTFSQGAASGPRSVPLPPRPVDHYDYDEETPEVMWTDEGGYVQVPSHQSPPRQDHRPQQRLNQRPQQPRHPGPDDYHISHRGPGRPPALGAGHGESVSHDPWSDEHDWGDGDVEALSKVEEAAMVRLSQQATRSPSKPGAVEAGSRPPAQNGSNAAQQQQQQLPPPADSEAILEMRREKEEMERKLQEALSQLKQRTNAMYQRDGEIKMVRQRNDKAERDLAELHLTAQRQQQEFQRKLEEQEKTFAREKERLETTAAFDRIAQETSTARTVWPASVRRARRLAGEASQAFGAVTQQQYIPPPVAPTTPTKRRNGVMPPPTSGSATGSPSRARRERGDDFDMSPSSSKARAARQGSLPRDKSAKKATPKPPPRAFAGFDNSFVDVDTPTASSASKQLRKAKKQQQRKEEGAEEDRSPSGDFDVQVNGETTSEDLAAVNSANGSNTRPEQPEWSVKLAQSRQNRYFWAISWFSRKRTGLAALLLGHGSSQPLAPLSLPASRYLSAAVPLPDLVPDHCATLHRLLDTQVPTGAIDAIKDRHRAATELLLTTVTNSASSSDGERRFAFLTKTSAGDPLPQDEASFVAMTEADYWDCEESASEGMEDLYEDLAVALRTLMAVYLRLCMTDALQDTMALMTAVCISHPSFVNFLVSRDLPYELAAAQASSPSTQPQVAAPLPLRLNACLIESMRKACRILPLAVSSPISVVSPYAETLVPATVAPGATQSRKAKQQQREQDEAARKQPWDMGGAQRDALLVSMLDLVEVLAYYLGVESGRHLKEVFDAPGFIPTFLDAARPASTMRRFVRLLIRLCPQPDLWKTLIACRCDDALQSLPSLITSSRTPLLELLGKHLVDLKSKQKASEAHGLHVAVVTLLTQLIITHHDALLLARESKTVLAALVQSIYADSNLIWNDDGHGISARDNWAENICQRLVVDTRLLFYLYASPSRSCETERSSSPSSGDHEGTNSHLMDHLHSHESHLLLNGIRHCFVLSLSRLAFAEEPPWLSQDCVRELQGVAELCSDLLEMVLSPEEVEAAWEVCAEGEEQEDEGEEERAELGRGGRDEDEEMMELAERQRG